MWRSGWIRGGVVLGFAFGGFFDGILLHQILQWHHLLSLVSGAGDLRRQVLWDGYFHALMYLVAFVGLAGLWRAYSGGEQTRLSRPAGAAAIGFGSWHVVDAVLSHWILGIHRIRIDSERPLLWDLLWLGLFGLLPLLLGAALLRRPTAVRTGASPRLGIWAATLLALGAGAWTLTPPKDQRFTTVLFRADVQPAGMVSALAATDARLVWLDPAQGVAVVVAPRERRWIFFRYGAVLVSGLGGGAGCLVWTRA
ncbi:DUF2243 domain-containing protein [Phenylobacterium sp. LjRoot219]|uniref:DUF2243 domain-containing protein n=1 Tax=Phenylobacterium sp. LjRoot219 TaxID=3342283 RepID=UPI003ECDA513